MIFPSRELGKLPQEGYKHQAGNSQFPHTNIGLTSMIMNYYTNQEIVIQ